MTSPFERFVMCSATLYKTDRINILVHNNFRLFWNQTSFADNCLYLSDK